MGRQERLLFVKCKNNNIRIRFFRNNIDICFWLLVILVFKLKVFQILGIFYMETYILAHISDPEICASIIKKSNTLSLRKSKLRRKKI